MTWTLTVEGEELSMGVEVNDDLYHPGSVVHIYDETGLISSEAPVNYAYAGL